MAPALRSKGAEERENSMLDVLDELRWEPSVNATNIGVTVKNGVVTLEGQ